MDLFLLHFAINTVIAVVLALSFGLALVIERWCITTLFRVMAAHVNKGSKQVGSQRTRVVSSKSHLSTVS